jgi:hypothetical protein
MVDTLAIPPAIEPLCSDAQVAQMLDPTGARIKARSIGSEREAGGASSERGSPVSGFTAAVMSPSSLMRQDR